MSLHEWDRSFIAIQIEKSYQNITTPNYFFPVNTMKKKKKKEPYISSFAIIILNFSQHRLTSNPDRLFWRESMTHDRQTGRRTSLVQYFPHRFLFPLLLAFHIPFFSFFLFLFFFSSPPSTPPPTTRGLPLPSGRPLFIITPTRDRPPPPLSLPLSET